MAGNKIEVGCVTTVAGALTAIEERQAISEKNAEVHLRGGFGREPEIESK